MTSICNLFPKILVIQVEGGCNIRCLSCGLWETPCKLKSTFEDRLPEGPFLFPPLVHLIGGEPFQSEFLVPTLKHYKKKGAKTAVWTHGLVESESMTAALKSVDRFYVFLPAPDEENYRLITGEDRLSEAFEFIEKAKEAKKEVVISFAVKIETISFLPDIHELAQSFEVPLLIHYSKRDGLSKESIAYIYRYRLIRNVSIYVTTRQPDFQCEGVPYKAIEQPWQIGLNWVYHMINKCKPE